MHRQLLLALCSDILVGGPYKYKVRPWCIISVHIIAGDKFRMVIANSYREDGIPDDEEYNPVDTGPSRADSFEYVMYGKTYRIEGDDSGSEHGNRL